MQNNAIIIMATGQFGPWLNRPKSIRTLFYSALDPWSIRTPTTGQFGPFCIGQFGPHQIFFFGQFGPFSLVNSDLTSGQFGPFLLVQVTGQFGPRLILK